MKRNNLFGVWQRCPKCGTVFADRQELGEHVATHPHVAPEPIDFDIEDDEPQRDIASQRDTAPQVRPSFRKPNPAYRTVASSGH